MRRLFLACTVLGLLIFPLASHAGDSFKLVFDFKERVPFRFDVDPQTWRMRVGFKGAEAPELSQPNLPNPQIRKIEATLEEGGWTEFTIDFSHAFDVQTYSTTDANNLVFELLPQTGGAPVVEAEPEPLVVQRPMVVLDPGHGGIDSGAVRGDAKESDLMLGFAGILAEKLIRTGRFRVALTRNDDQFLRLSERIAQARNNGAFAFISLHADALDEGKASGAAVFTLSEEASSAAAAELVAAQDRADVLSGDPLDGVDDELTEILVTMVQRDTGPRSQSLAVALVDALSEGDSKLRRRARQSANFGVLKAPDIPSVLIELGFMSDEGDLKNLLDPEWQDAAAYAISKGLQLWLDSQEAEDLGGN